jgi:hypothetical protein
MDGSTSAISQIQRTRAISIAQMSSRSRSARTIVAAIAMAIVLVIVLRPVEAELENHVFTSRNDRIRLVVPRGWRESDAPSYPGLLLWMMRPDAKIVLTAEPFTRELYCSWPVTCRTSHDFNSMTARYACALRQRLTSQRMRIGPVQAGPKENEDVGLSSVWFEYDDGKHYLRQAVALAEDRAISLVLSSGTAEARTSNARAFDQALRTLRPLSAAELGAGLGSATSNAGSAAGSGARGGTGARGGSAAGSAATTTPPPAGPNDTGDAGVAAASVPADAAVLMTPAIAAEMPAPMPKQNPVGPCVQR